jgi:DNA-binding beta-propeller fold protein YncE
MRSVRPLRFRDPRRASRLAAASVVLSVASILGMLPVFAEEPPLLVGRWGAQGSEAGLFEYPLGIAIDSSDVVYVSDTRNHRIQQMRRDGTFIAIWGEEGTAPGQFRSPGRLVVDVARGWVYVADTGNDRIQKFDLQGQFLDAWVEPDSTTGPFVSPFALALDPEGFLYVSDPGRGEVLKLTAEGTHVTSWTSPLEGGRPFVGALGITANEEHVYVTEAGNFGQGGCHCVIQFTHSGNYLRHWGMEGQLPQQFITPLGITTDAQRNVYVVDHHNFRIQKFTANGSYLSSWGGRDRAIFIDPHDITVDRRGDLFITDFGGDRGQIMHFSYQETPVQPRTWTDVKRSFRSPRPRP